MKLFLTVLGCAMVGAIAVHAGGLADAVVETSPQVMAPDQSSGSVPNWVVPLAIVGLMVGAAVLANDGDSDGGAS